MPARVASAAAHEDDDEEQRPPPQRTRELVFLNFENPAKDIKNKQNRNTINRTIRRWTVSSKKAAGCAAKVKAKKQPVKQDSPDSILPTNALIVPSPLEILATNRTDPFDVLPMHKSRYSDQLLDLYLNTAPPLDGDVSSLSDASSDMRKQVLFPHMMTSKSALSSLLAAIDRHPLLPIENRPRNFAQDQLAIAFPALRESLTDKSDEAVMSSLITIGNFVWHALWTGNFDLLRVHSKGVAMLVVDRWDMYMKLAPILQGSCMSWCYATHVKLRIPTELMEEPPERVETLAGLTGNGCGLVALGKLCPMSPAVLRLIHELLYYQYVDAEATRRRLTPEEAGAHMVLHVTCTFGFRSAADESYGNWEDCLRDTLMVSWLCSLPSHAGWAAAKLKESLSRVAVEEVALAARPMLLWCAIFGGLFAQDSDAKIFSCATRHLAAAAGVRTAQHALEICRLFMWNEAYEERATKLWDDSHVDAWNDCQFS